MRVWLVTIGEPLPVDGPGVRLMRAGILAEKLRNAGHEVVWWTSTFDHWAKRHRYDQHHVSRLESGVQLNFMHGCGYRRNISLARQIDHMLLAGAFRRWSSREPRPDLIVCSLPPIELARATARYGREQGVPVVLDIRDLWPDIFAELVPSWLRPLSRLALRPLRAQAKMACHEARAIVGNASDFVRWGVELAGRTATSLDKCFPFGYVTPALSREETERARLFWQQLGVSRNEKEFIACYIGSIGAQADFTGLIDAARCLEKSGRNARFVICGTGDRLPSLRAYAAGCESVTFSGWVGAPEIWTLMNMAQVGLAPYKSHAGYIENMPNKPIEYLAGGLPILSCLNGYLETFLERQACGLTYRLGDSQALCGLISGLMDDPARVDAMAARARVVYREQFDADKIYADMIDHLEAVAANG